MIKEVIKLEILNKKRALIITEVFFPEDFLINDLVFDWQKKKYSFEVFTRNPSYPKDKLFPGYSNTIYSKSLDKGILVHRVFTLLGYQRSNLVKFLNYILYFFLSFIFLVLNLHRYDRVFVYQTGPLSNAFSVSILKIFFKFKLIIWSQDIWPETLYAFGLKKTKFIDYFLRNFVRFIYSNCDFIFVSCPGFIKKINNLCPKKVVTWIPNWSLIDYKPKKSIKFPQGFNFTFTGNIGKVQNLTNVVLAFKKISDINNKVHLNFVGDGSFLQKLKKYVLKNKIRNVKFFGRKSLESMSDYLNSSDCLLISLSSAEIFSYTIPGKFQAYLSSKKPIYAVINGDVANLVQNYKIGTQADPDDIDAIAKGFERCLNYSSNEIKKISFNSGKLLKEKFDKDLILEMFDKKVWSIN